MTWKFFFEKRKKLVLFFVLFDKHSSRRIRKVKGPWEGRSEVEKGYLLPSSAGQEPVFSKLNSWILPSKKPSLPNLPPHPQGSPETNQPSCCHCPVDIVLLLFSCYCRNWPSGGLPCWSMSSVWKPWPFHLYIHITLHTVGAQWRFAHMNRMELEE